MPTTAQWAFNPSARHLRARGRKKPQESVSCGKNVRYHLRYQNHRLGRKRQRPSEEGLSFQRFILAPRPGLEPGTCGLTVRRSTN